MENYKLLSEINKNTCSKWYKIELFSQFKHFNCNSLVIDNVYKEDFIKPIPKNKSAQIIDPLQTNQR
jgi:hypothetical protein